MKEKFVKAVRKNGDSLAINIPSEIVELLGIKEGMLLRIEIEKAEK
ncbi:MAG: AbrB/MazE/SpoVT family DNA-binding domain-containing protein [archaeon]